MLRALQKRFYQKYKAAGVARRLKKRRFGLVIDTLGITPPDRVLEVGCSTGADFMQFAVAAGFTCHGVDIQPQPRLCDFEFTQGNACALPFPDQYFDAAVSIGVFEHIQPIEDLCRAAAEIRRVSQRYCIVVPAISTLLEPHTMQLLWALRARSGKHPRHGSLNYYADDVWLKFTAFQDAHLKRFSYMPGVRNLMIYGTH
ncbi:MAG TPA: methyltransferase domain-containing protein [Steroidobacter sp.]